MPKSSPCATAAIGLLLLTRLARAAENLALAPGLRFTDDSSSSPKAGYVEFRSFDSGYWSSWDRESAVHEQTLLAYGMNGEELMPGHGAPVRVYSAVSSAPRP